MEFRETLLAAQRNQQQKSSESSYYKARFDPPKKEQKQKDRLSANIQKFLAKKDEEEKQKKLEAQRKREELQAMRDPKALRKIQKTLKVIKSANKSVLEDAVDRDNTAVTLVGGEQPDQDDYGYESQEAAAIYAKMMQKYSKIPDEPKFPTGPQGGKKDLKGTVERVKHALQHEDDPVPHKRKRRSENVIDKDDSPTRYEPEKKEEKKPDKPKIRKPMPPPMDFNQLLKLAEQKKSEPVGAQAAQKKQIPESEHERPMTKKQRREYEEEMARRQRRQERLDAQKSGDKKPYREERPGDKEKVELSQKPSGFGRIPKLNDKNSDRNNSPKPADRERCDRDKVDRDRGDRDKSDKIQRDKDRVRQERERLEREKERVDREKDKIDRERLERLKAERERIDRELERLSKDKERIEKTEKKAKMENGRSTDRQVDRSKFNSSDSVKKSIDLKSQNTYRIDKNSNEKKFNSKNDDRFTNGHSSQSKVVPKSNKEQTLNNTRDKPVLNKPRPLADGKPENGKRLSDNKVPSKRPDDRGPGKPQGSQAGSSKPKPTLNTFDFDRHVNSLKKDAGAKNGTRPNDGKRRQHPDDVRKKPNRRVVDSESEYDSEMDDFIDDGDENMDYSRHIKEIFGYDKSKYRDMDDDDDPTMESSFARQQREEFISKKIGIMEDLEDMRMEAMEKKMSKKKRRISDD